MVLIQCHMMWKGIWCMLFFVWRFRILLPVCVPLWYARSLPCICRSRLGSWQRSIVGDVQPAMSVGRMTFLIRENGGKPLGMILPLRINTIYTPYIMFIYWVHPLLKGFVGVHVFGGLFKNPWPMMDPMGRGCLWTPTWLWLDFYW